MSPKEPAHRLGRGLASLLGEAAAPAPNAPGIRSLPIEQLEPSPFQPRGPIDQASLDELTSSIRARGILQPLLARPHPTQPDRYQIIAGERRWRAAQAAGLHEAPVLVRELSDLDAAAAALVENLQRQDLNPIEEAEGYFRLQRDFAMTQESLAEAIGKSRSHIANTLRLLTLPPAVQDIVRNGGLSAGHARALLAHPDPLAAAKLAVTRGLNVRQTEALATAHASPARAERPADAESTALARELSTRLGLRVEITFDGRAGQVRIHYKNLDQLDGLISLLGREQ